MHLRQAMQLLAKLEPLVPTQEAREDFRLANERLWSAFEELRPTRTRTRGRWVAAALVGISVAGGFVFLRSQGVETSRAAVSSPAAPQGSVAVGLGITAAAESLQTALQNFEDRLAMFGHNELTCTALDSAFATLNERWVAYSLERKGLAGRPDAERAAADRVLYAAMDSAEAHHGQSRCPRP